MRFIPSSKTRRKRAFEVRTQAGNFLAVEKAGEKRSEGLVFYGESLRRYFFISLLRRFLSSRIAQVVAQFVLSGRRRRGSFRLVLLVFRKFFFRVGIGFTRGKHRIGLIGGLLLFAGGAKFVPGHAQPPF